MRVRHHSNSNSFHLFFAIARVRLTSRSCIAYSSLRCKLSGIEFLDSNDSKHEGSRKHARFDTIIGACMFQA